MSDIDRFLRWVCVGCLLAVAWMGHLLADTREQLDGMTDEVRVLVADCGRRSACTFAGDKP